LFANGIIVLLKLRENFVGINILCNQFIVNISVKRLPKNPQRKLIWLKKLDIAIVPPSSSRICSLHFPSVAYADGKLLTTAEPIQALNSEYLLSNDIERIRTVFEIYFNFKKNICIYVIGTQLCFVDKSLFAHKKYDLLRTSHALLRRKLNSVRRSRNRTVKSLKALKMKLIEIIKENDVLNDRICDFHSLPLWLFKRNSKNAFPEDMKKFSSTLFMYSPKAYEFARKSFKSFPCKRTIQSWLS